MSRGLLDEATLKAIAERLPRGVMTLMNTTLHLDPDEIAGIFARDSTVPIAATCLIDTARSLREVMHALHEAYAHRIWYLEKRPEPSPRAAAWFIRFYSDDVALRLYASAEHLAAAIVAMLEIDPLRIPKIKKTSRNCAVGGFLASQMSEHPITRAVSELQKCEAWGKTMQYRHRWVHDQPPLLEGTGIVWKRASLWEHRVDEAGKESNVLTIGVGSKPEMTVEYLFDLVEGALEKFVETTVTVTGFYVDLLARRGYTIEQSTSED